MFDRVHEKSDDDFDTAQLGNDYSNADRDTVHAFASSMAEAVVAGGTGNAMSTDREELV